MILFISEDVKLFDVKVSELPAWFGRREFGVGPAYNEFVRNVWKVHDKWISGPVYGSVIKTIFRFIFAFSFINWLFKQHRYREIQKHLYH